MYSIIKFLCVILHLSLSVDLDQRQFPVVPTDSTYAVVNGGPDACGGGLLELSKHFHSFYPIDLP